MESTLIMSALENNTMGGDMVAKATEALSNGEMVETSTDTLQNVIANSNVPVNYGYYRKPIQQVRDGRKIGRNDSCPCGAIDEKTGKRKKFKNCCLKTGKYNQLINKE